MKKLLYTLFIIVSVFASCTEPINVDLRDNTKNDLVVEGSITTEHKVHEVILTMTDRFQLNERTSKVLDANVMITDGDTVINLYDADRDGVYKTEKELAGKVNHTYTLNITLSNGENYSATEKIVPVPEILSLDWRYELPDMPFATENIYMIDVSFDDNGDVENWYEWHLYIDGVNMTDTIGQQAFASDEFINNFNALTIHSFEQDELKNEKSEVKVKMLSISKEKYDFYYAIMLETDARDNIFAGTPANVPSNISNGALGFFSASAVSEFAIEVSKQE